jgi:Ca2+-dependent lipid-binding protein
VIDKTLNPHWNQVFSTCVTSSDKFISFKVNDQKTVGPNIHIGQVKFSLKSIQHLNEILEFSSEISDPSGKLVGLLFFSVLLTDTYIADTIDEDGSNSEGSPTSGDYYSDGNLYLSVIEAKDLTCKSVLEKNESSPYVSAWLGNKLDQLPGTLQKTKTIKHVLNPYWQEDFQWYLPPSKSRTGSPEDLHIEIFHHNSVLRDETMGHVVLPLSKLRAGEIFSRWFKLRGVRQGEIHLAATFIPKKLEGLFSDEISGAFFDFPGAVEAYETRPVCPWKEFNNFSNDAYFQKDPKYFGENQKPANYVDLYVGHPEINLHPHSYIVSKKVHEHVVDTYVLIQYHQ